MKEKRTLLQRLEEHLKKSATRVNPKAKKSFTASLRGRGYSKKAVKGVLKQASLRAKAAAAPPEDPGETPDPRTVTAARVRKLVKIGGQLRPSPRPKKGF